MLRGEIVRGSHCAGATVGQIIMLVLLALVVVKVVVVDLVGEGRPGEVIQELIDRLRYVCWRIVVGNITVSWLHLHGFCLVELGRLHIALAHEESVGVESSSLQEVTDDVFWVTLHVFTERFAFLSAGRSLSWQSWKEGPGTVAVVGALLEVSPAGAGHQHHHQPHTESHHCYYGVY